MKCQQTYSFRDCLRQRYYYIIYKKRNSFLFREVELVSQDLLLNISVPAHVFMINFMTNALQIQLDELIIFCAEIQFFSNVSSVANKLFFF